MKKKNIIPPACSVLELNRLKPFENVGIVGMPPVDVIRYLNERQVVIHDLDALLIKTDMEYTAPYLPRVYCAVLRTVVLNALHLDLDAIIVDTGPGKCNSAFHVAAVLDDIFSVPVMCTRNEDRETVGAPFCRARMDLTEKMIVITEGVKSANPPSAFPDSCRPTAGFWGVPPRDFSILSFFPDTTHVYGWTRCMENKTPADAELEAYFNPDIPTVFFAQTFCAKTALARLLAGRHPRALYLDVDVNTTSSAKAKIQAFLELTGVTS